MRLRTASGGIVEAEGAEAERLIARGFAPAAEATPKQAKQTKKPPTRRQQRK